MERFVRSIAVAGGIALAGLLTVAAAATESRGKARFEWQGQELVLEHGVVPVGKHRLDELRNGET
ncbi:MAG: hypothetical protein FJ293_15840, partial [Planctomycetes bacterium]|nr:hypothetical protein [Planctomycetota bacterium]